MVLDLIQMSQDIYFHYNEAMERVRNLPEKPEIDLSEELR